jgi:hypothetical protein
MAWNRDQIIDVHDRPMKEVKVPAWGEGASVWLRMISAAERDRYYLLSRKPGTAEADPENFRAKLLVFSICDENGRRLFNDDEFDMLGDKCGAAISLLFDEAQRLNKLIADEADEVEEARKNS